MLRSQLPAEQLLFWTDSLRVDDIPNRFERVVVDYGRQLASDPHGVSDELFGRLSECLRPEQIVGIAVAPPRRRPQAGSAGYAEIGRLDERSET